MTRQEFVKLCGTTCLAAAGMAFLGPEVLAAQPIRLQEDGNKLAIEKSKFQKKKRDEVIFRKYIKITPEGSDYPIVIYRFDEDDYAALLLQCTHRGTELNVNGDSLSCPAHDSEFSSRGAVLQGPADEPLRTFTVTSDEQFIYVNLV